MKKKNLNILAAVLVGVAVVGGVVLANGGGLMGNINQNRAATRGELAKSLAVIVSEDDNFEAGGCFVDVENHKYEKYACYLLDRGVINGFADGTFRPDGSVTRAEAAKLFLNSYEAAGGELVVAPNGVPYRDVDVGSWYYPYVVQIAKLGIPDVIGWKNKNFRPHADINIGDLQGWSRRLDWVLR